MQILRAQKSIFPKKKKNSAELNACYVIMTTYEMHQLMVQTHGQKKLAFTKCSTSKEKRRAKPSLRSMQNIKRIFLFFLINEGKKVKVPT